ncbi:MAG: NIF family HAD-type phosphatase [Bdellovibrionales bacterium]
MKTNCIIVDLDGTLANVDHRRKMLLEDNDWDKFNSNMSIDSVNLWCRELIDLFKDKYHIVIVSGRSDEFKEVTFRWLHENNIFFNEVFFRQKGDYRDDRVIKKEIFDTQINPRYSPLFVVDDRKKVVQMWRNIGLTCLQCEDGDY